MKTMDYLILEKLLQAKREGQSIEVLIQKLEHLLVTSESKKALKRMIKFSKQDSKIFELRVEDLLVN